MGPHLMDRPRIGSMMIFLLFMAISFFPLAAAAQPETPPILSARDLAPPELLAGPDFTVEETVPTDGFYGLFTVRGAYGSIRARGVAMLRVRVAETQAIARLEETSRREAVAGGAKDSAHQTVDAAKQVVRDPAGTVERVPETVGRLFSRVGGRIEKRVEKVTGGAERSASAAPRFGAGKARRTLAQKLGVDPYTDHPLLSAKLDQVARWEREGGLAVSIGTGAASKWAGMAAKSATLIWTSEPEEVRAANEKRLAGIAPGAKPEEIRRFLRNTAFTPTTQTLLIDEMEALRVQQGRDHLVRQAGDMETPDQARFLIQAVRTLGAYEERIAPVSSLESRGRLASGRIPDGTLLLPVPVDCLAWTERLVEFGGRPDLRAGRREILITGYATPRTRQELQARGWVFREGFQ